MTLDEQLRKPCVSLAKIGKRYYWTVWRFTDNNEEGHGDTICIRLADGFADTRADAASAGLAEIERIEPGLIELQLANWEKSRGWTHKFHAVAQHHRDKSRAWAFVFNSEGSTARALYRVHHVKPKAAKHSHAQAAHGCLWHYSTASEEADNWGWESFRITKITRKRVFIWDRWGDQQRSLDREALERDGHTRTGSRWRGREYYTDAGKEAWDRERAERHAEWERQHKEQVRVSLGEDGDLLGLPVGYTRVDVMRNFREQALQHHPDMGGDPVVFRGLVEAKERALAALHSPKRSEAA